MGTIQPNQRPTKNEQVRSPTASTPTPRYTGEPPLTRNPPAPSEPRQKQIHPLSEPPRRRSSTHHTTRAVTSPRNLDTSCQNSFVVELQRGRAPSRSRRCIRSAYGRMTTSDFRFGGFLICAPVGARARKLPGCAAARVSASNRTSPTLRHAFRNSPSPLCAACSSSPDEHNHEGGNHGTQRSSPTLGPGVRGR
jgi:hypothetical protein